MKRNYTASGHQYRLQVGHASNVKLIDATQDEWDNGGPWDDDRREFLSEGDSFQRLNSRGDVRVFLGWADEDE